MSVLTDKAIAFAQKQVDIHTETVNEIAKLEKNPKSSYTDFLAHKMGRLVKAEYLLQRWSFVLTFLKNSVNEGKTDQDIILSLKSSYDYNVKCVLDSRMYLSTNPITNAVENLRQDALKSFVDNDICYPSLHTLIVYELGQKLN